MKTSYLQKQMKQFLLSTALFAGLVTTMQIAQAGDRAGNGGSGDEVAIVIAQRNINDIAGKIDTFFRRNADVRDEFQEINFRQLSQVINDVRIEVTEQKLIDKNNVTRTCLNFPEELLIQCNLKEYTRLNNDVPTQFVLVLHELLGLVGIEESSPANINLIDSYQISQRLKKYVTKVDSYDLVYDDKAEQKVSKVIYGEACNNGYPGTPLFYPGSGRPKADALLQIHNECSKKQMSATNIKMKNISNIKHRGPGVQSNKCRIIAYAATFTCSAQ